MVSDRSVTAAKYGPVAAIACVIGLVVLFAVAAQVFEMPSPDAGSTSLYFFGLGGLFSLFGVLGFYQAQFILRHPQVAIEHDIQPPSKYDLSFETRSGAKKTGVLALLASLLSVAIGFGAVFMGL